MTKNLLVIALVAGLLLGCKKDGQDAKIYQGPKKSVHHGKAWTWVALSASGKPEKVAISINNEALNSEPVGNGGGGHNHDIMLCSTFIRRLPLHLSNMFG